MNTPSVSTEPVATTGMLIRRPAAEVFEAFVDPDITKNFWFTRGSGRLENGAEVQWEWEMYGLSISVTVKTVVPEKEIEIEWQGPNGGPKTVKWRFAPQDDETTFVAIEESGFTSDGDQLAHQVIDSTRGFTLVLAGAKAFLEHNIRLNLVADSHPAEQGS